MFVFCLGFALLWCWCYKHQHHEEDHEEDHEEPVYKKGWTYGTEIFVRYSPDVIEEQFQTEDGFYLGKIRKKQGNKFHVYFPCTGNTDVICPLDMEWYYAVEDRLEEWQEMVTIVLETKTLKAFRLKVERDGEWRGAKTGSTLSQPLRVWSVPGTALVYVGHLGVYEVVSVDDDGSLVPCSQPDGRYFIGQRKNQRATHFRDFLPLPRVEPVVYDSFSRHASTLRPRYPTLTREELN